MLPMIFAKNLMDGWVYLQGSSYGMNYKQKFGNMWLFHELHVLVFQLDGKTTPVKVSICIFSYINSIQQQLLML